jgi:outer membrane protein assembly factor BamE (lipoprotein component of BamABCDE complex)
MMSSRLSTFALALAALFLLPSLAGCLGKRSEMGVQNSWRGLPPPAFEKGRSTQSDVMRTLGPPSQVIALQDQTLFYYLREQSRTKAVFLIVYNQVRERITYDRALFFFSKEGILSDFSYSPEAIPLRE